jgi:uncharacterized membrane protein
MMARAYFLLYNHHMKTITKLRDKASHNILATLIIGLATMLFLLYEILGYRNFTWTVLDLGLFNRHMWSLARFSIATNPLKGINLLSDHAHFILIFLTPLYWIIPNPTLLLMTQAVCIGVSGIPIYKIARRHNSRNIAAMWLLPYYLYFGFWDMLGYPFHEVALAVPLLAWSLWFLLSKNYRGYAISTYYVWSLYHLHTQEVEVRGGYNRYLYSVLFLVDGLLVSGYEPRDLYIW